MRWSPNGPLRAALREEDRDDLASVASSFKRARRAADPSDMSSVVPQDPVGARSTAREKKLKVVILTPAWPGGQMPNGIVTYAAHVVPALREKGVEVFVVAGVDGSSVADPRVSVPKPLQVPPLRLALGRLQELFSRGASADHLNEMAIAGEVNRLVRDHGVDIVEMEESFGWCGWVATHCNVPIIARLHGPWFLNGAMTEDTTTRIFRRRVQREGKALERVAGISAPSRDVLERTRAFYGQALSEAEVIPNPLPGVADSDRWDPLKCEPSTVLFVGRFDSHKAGDVAIEAFARIRAVEPSARLVFAGADLGVNDSAGRRWHVREFIEDRLPREADRAAVEYLGPQPPAVIRQLRVRAAVTVVCSRWENFPYTLGEAMTYGCPVVATATGGLVEMVTDGETGLLARPADPDDLARAVLQLLRDPAGAAVLGRRAAEASAKQLSPASIAAQTLAFYRRVLSRKT
jgi:glycosyltransferase involved in cell wall biosynthesis